ncbi:SOS response-associated peptidase [Roseateles saccharophilus]|uniref:Abasic site processing protein n=1 Tax=Roseateles saccharophilus TaxID=304 RepID=A0A4R3UHP1_ROSSA|nr:SOS response-associated peptidase family protein [Roseateles saccharophilus]MDG0834815.1 SOS response-associated peptidase [Roseateles saccharophilus]TCU88938.1 SOS response associated peptidase (SRAP) [Roseateles saccharophilus]
MRSNYEPVTDSDRLLASFGVTLSGEADLASQCSAGVTAPFIVRAEVKSPGALGDAKFGLLGLLPHFATDIGFGKQTCNCRMETMKSQPAFRESWWAARRCVIPVELISEWNYESGRPQMWHVQRADEAPMGLAGLWNDWTSPAGERVLSFSLLTLNADGHEVFGRLNAPDHEKRMPVILPINAQELWLYGAMKDAERLLTRYPAEQLQATSREPPSKAWTEPESWAAVPDMFASEWHALAAEQPPKRAVRAPRALAPKPHELPGPITGDLF